MLTRLTVLFLALLLIIGLLAAWAWNEPARMAAKDLALAGQARENGARLYRSHCAGCHGVAGLGIDGVAPALAAPDFFTRRLIEVDYPGTLRSYIESTVAAGRPIRSGYSAVMPAWGQAYGGSLRQDEIAALASFILNWDPQVQAASAATATPLPAAALASAAERGKAVFYGPAGCLGCHGRPGTGGISGPDLAGLAGRAAVEFPGLTPAQAIRQSILAPGARLASHCRSATCPDLMPRDYSLRLHQEDLDALIVYLLTLEPAPTGGGATMPTATPAPEAVTPAAPTPIPTLRPATGDLALGEQLYGQECAACHGDRGQGAWAGSLNAVFDSVEPFQYVRAVLEQGIPGVTMPAWGAANGGRLSEAELDALAAYVASRRSASR